MVSDGTFPNYVDVFFMNKEFLTAAHMYIFICICLYVYIYLSIFHLCIASISSHAKGPEQDQLRSPFVPYVRNTAERSIHNCDSQPFFNSTISIYIYIIIYYLYYNILFIILLLACIYIIIYCYIYIIIYYYIYIIIIYYIIFELHPRHRSYVKTVDKWKTCGGDATCGRFTA